MRRVWGLALFCVGAGLFIALIFPKTFWQAIIYSAAETADLYIESFEKEVRAGGIFYGH